jgi:acyl-CoA synthetase (AMP-forming)/AMP-acid ligase II
MTPGGLMLADINQYRTIPDVVRRAALSFGDKPAIIDGTRRISFAGLEAAMLQAAAAFLGAGVQPGDRVSIWAPNSLDWVVAALGVHAAGACIVPLNTRFKAVEAGYILNRSRARILIAGGRFLGETFAGKLQGIDLPHLERVITLPDTAGEAMGDWAAFLATGTPALQEQAAAWGAHATGAEISDIMFTSGTTGYPKGVITSHAQNIRVYTEWARCQGLTDSDRFLVVYPFFHCSGYKSGWLACLIAGATSYPLAVLDVAALGAVVAAEKITFLPGPPTLFQTLLAAPPEIRGDLSSIRVVNTGASAVPPASIARIHDELGADVVMTGYGLTETCGTVTLTDHNDGPEVVARYCGKALPGVEIRCAGPDNKDVSLGEPGEVLVRGYNVMQGYFDDAAATAKAIDADGWLHTGDIGILDERGYLRLTDRKTDMFIVGGFNCYPAEIERIMCGNPAFAQVAVIGVPDDRMGEVGKAYVVLRQGGALTPDAVIAWCRDAMANYKVPRYVEIVETLPLNAVGKVQKFVLRDAEKSLVEPK